MLLGAAEVLQKERNFDGIVRLIFQPAEENGLNGAKKMLDEGLQQRFPMDEVYAIHNWPDLPVGSVGVLAGPVLASSSAFDITLTGQGAHGSTPQDGTPLVAALAHIILAVEGYLANRRDPRDRIVATLPVLEGSSARTILPEKVCAAGSMRCLDQAAQAAFFRDVPPLIQAIAQGFGAKASVILQEVVPITTNAQAQAKLVQNAVLELGLTLETEETGLRPIMGSEDFSFTLQERPGCYFLLGQGRPGFNEPLHAPRYDFNDDVIPFGMAMYSAIVSRALPLSNDPGRDGGGS